MRTHARSIEPAEEEKTAADLVRRIQAGDTEAEHDLVERYQRGLAFQLSRMTNDQTLAEDLRQDTLLAVLQKVRMGELRQPESLAGFIRNIGKNLYIAHYRKMKRRGEELTESFSSAVDTDNPTDRLMREEESRIVRQMLNELKHERDRRLLFQFYIAQNDKQHICEMLDISPTIFNKILHRARTRFREQWEAKQRSVRGPLSVLVCGALVRFGEFLPGVGL